MRNLMFIAALVALTAVACAADDGSDTISDPTSTTTETPDMSDETTTTSVPETPVEQSIADLATELDIDPASIVVVSSENVTWRSGAIGCPEPDMSYTQALVDGFRIVLEVDGTQYVYHQGGDGAPFLCEDPQEPLPSQDV